MRRTTAVGILLLVIGVTVGAGIIFADLRATAQRVDALQRVPPRAGGSVTFDHAGEVVVYAEVDHVVGRGSAQPRLTVALASGAPQVAARPYEGSSTYNLSGHSGIAIATLAVPAPGRYDVWVSGSSPGDGVLDVALGESVMGPAFVVPLVAGILVLVGSVVAGVLNITAPRRAARRAAASSAGAADAS